ncbi:retrovirus-related pol polyprotein from transposon TNT 1-94 [Tanacetum coccineum]|uniref:Retrovirus-related pol polyprotein from transposon TNT 1-94 n=1 Tax=Tanacetum coccineum TaxID=301880 RepID=A0ABQ5BY53_9ASTR
MRVESINGKRYILVIGNDRSRFTWAKFLRTKDEAPKTIIKFLKQAQVSLKVTLRYLRIDNDTKFINQTLRKYTEDVEITHHTSVTRTSQQNGVVEWRNRTLVESARTMLIFSKSSLFQWAKDVATASGASSSTTIDQDSPSPSTSPNNETIASPINSTNVKQLNNEEDAEFNSDTFTNPFAPPTTSSAESSSKIIKDHPLVIIIGNPSTPISTGRQLVIDALWCYFHAFLVKEEPKNYKEAMKESSWIEAIQEEIHEFDQLKV